MSIHELSDAEIIGKLQDLKNSVSQNQSVFNQYYEVLFERYSKQVYSLCRYYGLRHNDAHDVLQDSFIKLYHNIGLVDCERPFKPYFFKIVMNLLRDKYRAIKKNQHQNLDDLQDENFMAENDLHDNLQDKHILCSIINSLPDYLREVMVMKVYGDLELSEISRTLGISQRTAYNYYYEALEKVRLKIGGTL